MAYILIANFNKYCLIATTTDKKSNIVIKFWYIYLSIPQVFQPIEYFRTSCRIHIMLQLKRF